MTDFVEETWQELGTRVRPLRDLVFLRTVKPSQQTEGGIWFAPSDQNFYDGPLHLRLMRAIVLAAGPRSVLQPGDHICFQRLYLSRWKGLQDGTFVGWLREIEVALVVDPDVEVSRFLNPNAGPRAPLRL
jgi:co-chaperonin GroES (HSP10)